MTSKPSLDPRVLAAVQTALGLAREGDLASARATAERALALGKDQVAIQSLLGTFCCQQGDLAAGIRYLRIAWLAASDDAGVTFNLARALMENGTPLEALAICSQAAAASDKSMRLWRLRAYLLQQQENYSSAATAYKNVVAVEPKDFESWNNLGNALAGAGDVAGSIKAIEKAMKLRPDIAPLRINLATTLIDAGELQQAQTVLEHAALAFPLDEKPWVELAGLHKLAGRDAEALVALKSATARNPEDADLLVKLGMEYLGAWAMSDAENVFRRAVKINPDHSDAHILLALLLEHTNKVEALSALLRTLEIGRIDAGAVAFVRALVCRREKRFADGLVALALVPEDIEPARSAQLRGQFHDRLGDPAEAFAAFEAMNELHKADPSDPVQRGLDYRTALANERVLVTEKWVSRWTPSVPYHQKSPVFLVGFPRSGTTLLDTILMGHPDVQVMEERPPLNVVERTLGSWDKLATLDEAEVLSLREVYFNEVANWTDRRPEATLIDKSPLHMNRVPMIHRLFPDAKIILALRHPCDVVLSCFITNFRLNNAMASFIDLSCAADLYNMSFGCWTHSTSLLPVSFHELRYEAMVADKEAVLRPLFDFLDLEWRPEVLDHRQTAANRGIISTASYSQVTEPIYDHAAGRWTRYREQLSPVLAVLAPWADRYGYTV